VEKSGRGFPSGGRATWWRNTTVLSSFTSSVQMNFAPAKSASKNGCLGSISCSEYWRARPQPLSSKSTANQSSGSGVFSTRGLVVSPPTGPWEKHFAFQEPSVTVPSANLRMKPPSPMFVLAYSMPVFGSALSRASTAIVIG